MSHKVPTRYVSLHNHTAASPYDGLGSPEQHFEFCIENGLSGHALTEHGNMNSQAHAQLWVSGWNKTHENKFKFIPGVEAYFHPDLKQWARDKAQSDEDKENAKLAKKLETQKEKAAAKLTEIDDPQDDIDMTNALVIENEDMSKSTKTQNPANRRHHLVLLPRNARGLTKLYSLVSKSYISGFYRFPRMDASDLRDITQGQDIISSSACIGGMAAYNIFQLFKGIEFNELYHTLVDDPNMLDRCVDAVGNYFQLMEDSLGQGNNYLELQFNKLPSQNLVNRVILEFVKRNGLQDKLIVTCDAHYYNPNVWRERELYKKLGFMNYTDYGPDSLPKSKDELKCDLYPKNAAQIWEEYLKSKENTSFYDDDVVCDAIERSYDIAHDVLDDVKVDNGPKYPTKMLVPPDTTSFKYLVELCKEGIVKRGLADKPEYVARLHEELAVIKQLNNADYFITYKKIIELAHQVVLVGPGRGSGGGSLINYVLFITDLDPVKWDLPFSRFMSVYRIGDPDIDCIHEKHLIVMSNGDYKRAGDIKIGDRVLGGDNVEHIITHTYSRSLRENEDMIQIIVEANNILGHLLVVPKHKMLNQYNEVIYAQDLQVGEMLLSTQLIKVIDIKHISYTQYKFVDLTVQDDARFHVIPFNVIEDDNKQLSYPDLYV